MAQQPAPAGFVDPAAEVRCQSLNAAQAAAQHAKAKALAKKQARQDALQVARVNAPLRGRMSLSLSSSGAFGSHSVNKVG